MYDSTDVDHHRNGHTTQLTKPGLVANWAAAAAAAFGVRSRKPAATALADERPLACGGEP